MAILASDTFVRANQSGLGTASDGEVWTANVTGASSSIVSNQANIASGDGGDMSWFLGNGTAATVNVSIRMLVASGAVGPVFRGNINGGFFNGYQVAIFGSNLLFVIETGNSHNVIQSVPIPAFDNTKYWFVRAVMVGSAYSARVWQDGTQEPSSWLFQGTDATYSTGGWGLATNQVATATLDNFVVTDNQSTTLSRIVPAHASLFYPSLLPSNASLFARTGKVNALTRSGVAYMEVRE